MGRHPNSLKALEENRKKGQIKSGEQAVRYGRKGGKESQRVQAIDRDIVHLFELAGQAQITNTDIAKKLNDAGLPPTFLGQMAYNVLLKAGTNPAMLKVLLEALGVIKGNQTTVNVNNNESPLSGFTKEELMKIAGLTPGNRNTSEN